MPNYFSMKQVDRGIAPPSPCPRHATVAPFSVRRRQAARASAIASDGIRGLMALLAAMLVGALLFAVQARAGQDDPALPALFKLLRTSIEGMQANLLQHQIWVIWHQHEDPELTGLLNRGITAMHESNFEVALVAFDAVIEMDPGFAEGWNKRATLYYLMGDYDRSVIDIQKTLELELRHFGALSGLWLINMSLGRTDAAIAAFEQTIAVNPHATGAQHNIEMLKKAKEREKI